MAESPRTYLFLLGSYNFGRHHNLVTRLGKKKLYFTTRQHLPGAHYAATEFTMTGCKQQETMSNFNYTPLAHRQIRLLQFSQIQFRTGPASPLCTILKHVSLDDKPCFHAISHDWGDPIPTHDIIINGQKACITEKADQGLRGGYWARDCDGIWLDSVCIDQTNLAERGEQVQLMKEIYSAANKVWIWLGVNERLAVGFLPRLLSAMLGPGLENLDIGERMSTTIKRTSTTQQSPEWKSLQRLFCSPWFERIWIVQEVVLASEAWVIAGEKTCSWRLLALVVINILHLKINALMPGGDVFSTKSLQSILEIQMVKNEAEKDLGDLMTLFRGWKASDQRDKIYGILGLASDRSVIVPDYTLSLQEAWTSVYRTLLLQNVDLRILYYAGIGLRRNIRELPSWVPDLSTDRTTYPLVPFSMHAEGKGYDASKNTEPSIKFNEQGDMVLLGVDVDEVRFLAAQLILPLDMVDIIDYEKLTVDTLADMLVKPTLWIEETLSFVTEKLPLVDSKFDTETFWRTLIGNMSNEKGPAPQCYGEYYMSYRMAQTKARYLIWSERSNVPTMNLEEGLKMRAEYGITTKSLKKSHLFELEMFNNVVRRKVCVTKNGSLAIVPELTMPTDQICIIAGSKVPWVTRSFRHQSQGKEGKFTKDHISFVGECYTQGLMCGEGLEGREMREFIVH
jgi:hypothetical protein